ncbi:hypothetical protein CR513_12550, partial [Mucuna pruriens]
MIARVLIDNGSSLNVLPKATLDKLASIDAQLKASPVVVRAFDGSKREVMGEISLPILIGPVLFNIDFQVMDIRPAYNCLLGRPWIHVVGVVPSSLHQQVKFISDHRIISILGEKELVITTPAPEEYIEGDEEALETSFQSLEVNSAERKKSEDAMPPPPPQANTALQIMIKGGYQPGRGLGPHLTGAASLIQVFENPRRFGIDYQGSNSQGAIRGHSFVRESVSAIGEGENVNAETKALADIERDVDRERPRFEAQVRDLESVSLQEETEGREFRIGKQLPPASRAKLLELLKEYTDIFAWSYQDMPGLDRQIVEHRLPLLPGATPIRQQLRRMKPEVALKIKDEVEKQWNAGFLAVAHYPKWVANIVPVPKKDGKVRMCVDYRDLNKASPKDNFPLPHIDILVDNTAQHSFFSFMDGFSGYNQIMMLPEDQEKTTFITLWGTFCYKVMPFGLKNAGATYQRAMVTLFHDMMHKEIENNTLRKLFLRLRKYKLRLNPAKCTFGVKTGKLLGFVVNEEGIEVDPDKVRAIREMPPPRTEAEVRGFLGRVNFISRFISQLTATCSPIFKLLRKKQRKEWDTECQKAFEKIKHYLENPPVLVPVAPGRPLILYLTVLEESMGRTPLERKNRPSTILVRNLQTVKRDIQHSNGLAAP